MWTRLSRVRLPSITPLASSSAGEQPDDNRQVGGSTPSWPTNVNDAGWGSLVYPIGPITRRSLVQIQLPLPTDLVGCARPDELEDRDRPPRKRSAISSLVRTLLAHGAVAQLGEHLDGIEKVVGSIPFRSTKDQR